MKNISNALGRSNLTAHERFLLLIQNDVHKAKTGKEILSEADKAALENWRAANDGEAREWNRLNEGWKHSGRMDIEVEFIYKDAHIAYLAQMPILMQLLYYPAHSEMSGSIKTLNDLKKVTVDEAAQIAAKQRAVKLKEGLDFEYAVYKLAFERLSAEDKKSMTELYADVETDHQYLDQEEIIASLFNGKKTLTAKAKEKLSKLVAEWSYNKFAKEYQLFHYFACIPLVEVARYFLKDRGIEITGKPMSKNQDADDDDVITTEDVTKAMEANASKHKTTIQEMLQDACLKWLDDGLFDAYTPLVLSDSSKLFDRWLKSKKKAQAMLRKHIDDGELVVRNRTKEETLKEKLYSKGLYDVELAVARAVMENIGLEVVQKGELDEKPVFETFSDTVITGESLYAFKENYEFIDDFKKRTDEYDPNLGLVYEDNNPEKKGEHLDQEFVICDLNNKGEPSIFSRYGMAMRLLSGVFESNSFFAEEESGGKTFLKFKSAGTKKIFLERRNLLISGYAKLLAFEGVFKKLAKIYEADMPHHVVDRIKETRANIELYNESVRLATNDSDDERKKMRHGFRRMSKLHTEEEWTIDPDTITPDEKAVEEHITKLEGILGSL